MKFTDLSLQTLPYKQEIEEAIHRVLYSGQFVLGPEISLFEQELKEYTGCNYAISCGSGTQALLMSLMAAGVQPGDEVITSPFSFIASTEVLLRLGIKPVFVDIEPDTYLIDANQIESVITSKTKAILPVSLYGAIPNMTSIVDIAKHHKLWVIEDGAQSFGAEHKGKKSGNTSSYLKSIGCTSFFPTKPLGGFGEGGAIFTNHSDIAETLTKLRIHGQSSKHHQEILGLNGRLDALQAAILRVKLRHFEKDLSNRKQYAKQYHEALSELEEHGQLKRPSFSNSFEDLSHSVYGQYTIRCLNHSRAKLISHLEKHNVPHAIHYPIPLHLQNTLKHLGHNMGDFPQVELAAQEVLSLPIGNHMKQEDLDYVKQALRSFSIMISTS